MQMQTTGKNDGPIEVDHMHDFTGHLLTELLAVRQSDAESGICNASTTFLTPTHPQSMH